MYWSFPFGASSLPEESEDVVVDVCLVGESGRDGVVGADVSGRSG